MDNIKIVDRRCHFEMIKYVVLAIFKDVNLTRNIPVELKTVIVRSLFKTGKRNSVEETFRSISILSSMELIVEKHLCKEMIAITEKLKILCKSIIHL